MMAQIITQEYKKERAKELKEKFEKYHKENKYGENDKRSPYEQIREIEKSMKYPVKSRYYSRFVRRARKENDADVNDLELVYNRWQKQPQNDEEQKQMEKEINETRDNLKTMKNKK